MTAPRQDRVGRRWVLGAAAGLALAGMNAVAANAAESFRQEVAGLLHRRRPALKFTLPENDADAIHVEVGENIHQVFLGNLQREIGDASGTAREKQILDFFDHVTAITPGGREERGRWEEARAELRIQLVPIEYRQQATNLLSRDLAGKVVIAYARDRDQSYSLVTGDDLKSWGVDADAVHAAAMAGLEAASAKLSVEAEKASGERGAYGVIATNDGYDAARLLIPSIRQRLRQALSSDFIIVGIPNRDFLVAWTPDFSARAGFAAKVAEDSKARSHPLTDELFVVDANGVRMATSAKLAEQRRI